MLYSPVPAALVKLTTQPIAAAVAAVTFASLITAQFEEYQFHLVNVVPVDNNKGIRMRLSKTAGASWLASYLMAARYNGADSGSGANNQPAIAAILLSASGNAVGNTAARGGLSGIVTLRNPAGTATNKSVSWHCDYAESTSRTECTGTAESPDTAAVDAVIFDASSGQLASGLIVMYGVGK